MTEVHTVSIVARTSTQEGRASGTARGGTMSGNRLQGSNCTREMFARRFALNGSSRQATIMAMGISIKTAEPSRAHGGDVGRGRFGGQQ